MDKTSSPKVPAVLVIGACMIDLIGKSTDPLIMADSNPGLLTIQAGGVSHNISCNLAQLGADVSLISTLCSDSLGNVIKESLRESNVKFDQANIEDAPSPSYLAILDTDGDLSVSISDTTSLDLITPEFLSSKKDYIDTFDIIVVDATVHSEHIETLFKNHPDKRFYLEPVSIGKAKYAKQYLDRFYSVKCNEREAGYLIDLELVTDADFIEAANRFHKLGVEKVIITRGSKGGLYSHHDTKLFYEPAKAKMLNATGAGDAFMAGYLYGELYGMSAHDTIELARQVAAMAVETIDTVNKSINLEKIKEKMYA